MTFRIEYAPAAVAHLKALTARQQSIVLPETRRVEKALAGAREKRGRIYFSRDRVRRSRKNRSVPFSVVSVFPRPRGPPGALARSSRRGSIRGLSQGHPSVTASRARR